MHKEGIVKRESKTETVDKGERFRTQKVLLGDKGNGKHVEIAWMHPPKCVLMCRGGKVVGDALKTVINELRSSGVSVLFRDMTRTDDGKTAGDGWATDQSNRLYINGTRIGDILSETSFCHVRCSVDSSTTCYKTRMRDGPKGNPEFLIRKAVSKELGI